MLHHFHGTPKHMLPAKAFGCFRHVALEPSAPLLQGFSDSFLVPVSRWTEVRDEDLGLTPELRVLLHSDDVGPCLIEDRGPSRLLHVQPPRVRLDDAQGRVRARPRRRRTRSRRRSTTSPTTTRPQPPENRWRSHGQLLYGNWINEIYQTTPYEIEAIGA